MTLRARTYDPVKAHKYYEEHKHLKGRQRSGVDQNRTNHRIYQPPPKATSTKKSAQARVLRLTEKIAKLNHALKEAQDALRAKQKAARENSDGKSTAKQKQLSKEYRQKHKNEIAQKRRREAGTKSGGSGTSTTGGSKSSSPTKKSVSQMSETELKDRIRKIKSLISSAKTQLRDANALSHSHLIGDDYLHLVHDGMTGRYH